MLDIYVAGFLTSLTVALYLTRNTGIGSEIISPNYSDFIVESFCLAIFALILSLAWPIILITIIIATIAVIFKHAFSLPSS